MEYIVNQGISFDYNSPRARKAHWAYHLHLASHDIYGMLMLAGLLLAGGGIAIVLGLGVSAGWIMAGLAAPFWMIAAYGKDLRELPPEPNAHSIDGVLDAKLLGLLPAQHSPEQVAHAVLHVPGGIFIGARFGVGQMLLNLTSKQPADSAAVWQRAEDIRASMSAPGIDASMVAAALLLTLPDSTRQLAQAHLGEEDILAGVRWYAHFTEMATLHRQKHHDGGIGRDWSFGYTPMLSSFGYNMSQHINLNGLLTTDLPSREPMLAQIMDLLSKGGRLNAAIVGQLGSGKTTLVHDLAAKLASPGVDVPRDLRYRQIVALDPSSLISRAKGRGELEELINRLCREAYNAKNIILFLDDAQLFFEDGTGSVDLTNVLMPILEGGGLKLIVAMDEQRWTRISQANPALSQYLNRVVLPPTDKQETIIAMQDELIKFEFQHRVTYTYQALEAAYRLSSRYLAEQAMPGKAVKLLESAAGSAEDGIVTQHSVEKAIERTQGIKVGTADTGEERQTLLHLEQLIHARMINQTRAVQVVSDALRRARAGVRSTNRPIGTFLFLGPTGVGKTELAKSVGAVFFGGEDRLIRIDLNEYVGANDVSRLIADASQDQHSLTAQIARQPFSVVLLDEIEKAHPNVLNTLLQLLDEGILRDITNREVSFRDAVIIATSNAGADRIRQHIEAGQQLEQFEQQFTDELINAQIFRPEFLNRFDEIVLFRPLKPDELLQVIDLILQGVNKNLADQKVSVVVDQDAKQMLVGAGYDPRLGARPMRRVVQRVVENIVANQMLTEAVQAGGQVHVTAQDVQTMLQRGGN